MPYFFATVSTIFFAVTSGGSSDTISEAMDALASSMVTGSLLKKACARMRLIAPSIWRILLFKFSAIKFNTSSGSVMPRRLALFFMIAMRSSKSGG